jgi:putative NADH-flavin reductase
MLARRTPDDAYWAPEMEKLAARSPSADLAPSERTERFRLGSDQLLRDAQGRSRTSMDDFAVAKVDGVERPAHSRPRFTVGY